MKVTSKIHNDEDTVGGHLSIEVDGKCVFSVLADPECPEDFSFYRNLNDCYKIPHLMCAAYEAGKRGETFEIEDIEGEDG